jgi:hypothetical protein
VLIMMHRMNRWLLAGIVSLGLGASAMSARAAEEAKGAPAKTTETKKVETPKTVEPAQARPAGLAIDFARLGQILDDMGYEYKKVGESAYDVVLTRDGWTIYLRLAFSSDKTRLWLVSSLETIEDVTQAPHEILVKLMEANNSHSPSAFYMYNPKDQKKPGLRYLKIGRPVDNRGINARTLRAEIDAVFTSIRGTMQLWKAEEWKKLKPTTTTTGADKEAKTTK